LNKNEVFYLIVNLVFLRYFPCLDFSRFFTCYNQYIYDVKPKGFISVAIF